MVNNYHKLTVNKTHTIPYRFYSDAEILKKERNNIFKREWQFVGHSSQIQKPGEFFTCEIAEEPILVLRGEDNEVKAYYNICPHRATQLEPQDQGKKKVLQCSYHGWTFKLDGQLLKAPNFKDSECFCSSEVSLRSVKVETELSMIFINLDDNAKPLRESNRVFFEDLEQFQFMKDLKLQSKQKRIIKANWKAYIDNYLECDHCSIAHPELMKTLDMKTYQIINKESCTIQGAAIKPEAKHGQVRLQDGEVKEGRYYWVWPNIIFSINPGPGNLATTVLHPIDENTTLLSFVNYFVNNEPTAEQSEAIRFVDQLRKEDFALVEKAQIGYRSSAFESGIYSPTEHALRHFHNHIITALNQD